MWCVIDFIQERQPFVWTDSRIFRSTEPGTVPADIQQHPRQFRCLMTTDDSCNRPADPVKSAVVNLHIRFRIDKADFDKNCDFIRVVEEKKVVSLFSSAIDQSTDPCNCRG